MARYEDHAATAAGTTQLWQRGDWRYLKEVSDERILAIMNSETTDGTSAAAEKFAAKCEAILRKLIRNDLHDPQYE